MMGAAMLGLLLANSPFGSSLLGLINFKLHLDWLDIHITLGHIVSDLLLAVFFFLAGAELKYELKIGTLSSVSKALVPISAALGGVVVPAAIYIWFNWGQESLKGWPIPTATDIAFALGILALFGRGMPRQARIFLLALAIFDDLIAITIIAVAYTADLETAWLIGAFSLATAAWFIERSNYRYKLYSRIAFGLLIWYFVYQSGVHATVAGVLLGLTISAAKAHSVMAPVQLPTNFFILPLFAFTAVAVPFPQMAGNENPVFTGILVGLAVGKALGITAAAVLANLLVGRKRRIYLGTFDFLGIGFLGGVGFTVSLLMAHLAFLGETELYAQATLGVLLGSFVSMALGGAIIAWRARVYRTKHPVKDDEETEDIEASANR